MRWRGGRAGHFEVTALAGAAGVDEDTASGKRRLEALEPVGEDFAGRRPAFRQGPQFIAAVEAAQAVQPLRGGHPLRYTRLKILGMLEDGLREQVALDHVVVEVVQAGPVRGKRPEAGRCVELR